MHMFGVLQGHKYCDGQANKVEYRFQNITKTMYDRPGDFPKLSGRAADIRELGKPLLAVFTEYMDTNNRIHRQT
eukprot:5792769-Alexandrium_andersonii.AAC.1